MLKSACCFFFLSALIFAVYSEDATSNNNPPNVATVNNNEQPNAPNSHVLTQNEDNIVTDPKFAAQAQNAPQTQENKVIVNCITCDQTESADCLLISNNQSSTTCDVQNGNKCYMEIKVGGFIKRGCADETLLKTCNSNKNCETCEGDNCNSGIFRKDRLYCKNCDPSKSDCSNPFFFVQKLCTKYNETEQCYIHKVNNERGCLSETTLCTADSCHICKGNECNIEIPKKTIAPLPTAAPVTKHCITCNQTNIEDQDCLQISNNNTSPTCEIQNGNKCFMQIKDDGFITRGCANESFEKTCNSTINCETCVGDNCNNIVFPEARLSCLNCDPLNCSNSSSFVPKLCTKYNETEQCYSHKENNERGCLSETKLCVAAGSCDSCKGKDCNKVFHTAPLIEITTTAPKSSASGNSSATTIISFLFISFSMLLLNK